MTDVSVEVRWDEALRFEASGRSGIPVVVDGEGAEGPSPMESLLIALTSCMAIDVVDMLGKMRVPLGALVVQAGGDRRPDPPRRYTAVRLLYRAEGVSEDAHPRLHRAIELSRDKYCSVLHTLQPDLDLSIRIETS